MQMQQRMDRTPQTFLTRQIGKSIVVAVLKAPTELASSRPPFTMAARVFGEFCKQHGRKHSYSKNVANNPLKTSLPDPDSFSFLHICIASAQNFSYCAFYMPACGWPVCMDRHNCVAQAPSYCSIERESVSMTSIRIGLSFYVARFNHFVKAQ